jgi:hypothetical protein
MRSARRKDLYLNKTQQTREKNTTVLSGIRTRDLSNQAAAYLHLRPQGHRYHLIFIYIHLLNSRHQQPVLSGHNYFLITTWVIPLLPPKTESKAHFPFLQSRSYIQHCRHQLYIVILLCLIQRTQILHRR